MIKIILIVTFSLMLALALVLILNYRGVVIGSLFSGVVLTWAYFAVRAFGAAMGGRYGLLFGPELKQQAFVYLLSAGGSAFMLLGVYFVKAALMGYLNGKRQLAIWVCVSAFLAIGCAGRQMIANASKFEWLPTECAPVNYPAQLLRSYFVFADGSTIYIPGDQLIQNGWGRPGSVHIIGARLKPVPTKLVIHWFSYLENRFYSGRFDLPVARIREMFERGVASHEGGGKRLQYKTIAVGVAPGGDISIWMIAERIVTEVATFRANERDLPWNWVLDNPDITRDQYISDALNEAISPEILKELRRQPIPIGRWGEDTQRWPWSPVVSGPFKQVEFWVRAFNGEHSWIELQDTTNTQPSVSGGSHQASAPAPAQVASPARVPTELEVRTFQSNSRAAARALPSELTFFSVHRSGSQLKSTVSLDRDETRSAMLALATDHGSGPDSGLGSGLGSGQNSDESLDQSLVLRIDVDSNVQSIKVYLIKGEKIRELTRIKAQTFQLDSNESISK